MRYGPEYFKDKYGCEIVLRSAEPSDAPDLIRYLMITSGETPYLIRDPDEITITVEQEEGFIRGMIDSSKELMLLSFAGGKHIGNCSLMSIGGYKRYSHRCSIAVALYKEYHGRGIGRLMMETVLDTAKELGYEQAELEVVSGNASAIALYEKLGFRCYGTFPNNMKFSDGSYSDALWMMKKL